MNVYVPLIVVASLCVAGCGKKKEADRMHKNERESTKMADTSSDIPVYNYDDKDLFQDDSDVNQFAFVDETSQTGDTETTVAQNDFVELSDEVSLAWDEENAEASFETIHFDFDRDSVRPDQKPLLQKDIQAAQNVLEQGKKVIVQGHCDQIGSAAYNMGLSERRAKTIKEEMVKSGLPEERIEIVGFGQEMPLVWTDETDRTRMIQELAANRRAEIVAQTA